MVDVPRKSNGQVDWDGMLPRITYHFDGYTTMGVGDKTWFKSGELTFRGYQIEAVDRLAEAFRQTKAPSRFRRWIEKPLTMAQFIRSH